MLTSTAVSSVLSNTYMYQLKLSTDTYTRYIFLYLATAIPFDDRNDAIIISQYLYILPPYSWMIRTCLVVP